MKTNEKTNEKNVCGRSRTHHEESGVKGKLRYLTLAKPAPRRKKRRHKERRNEHISMCTSYRTMVDHILLEKTEKQIEGWGGMGWDGIG
jgi:hypothetical protein